MSYWIPIPKSYVKNGNIDKKYLIEEHTRDRFLCEDSFVDITNNVLTRKIFRNIECDIRPHYFNDGKHLYINKVSIYKKKVHHIPYDSKHIILTRSQYKLHKKSHIKLIVDDVDGQKSYFIKMDDISNIDNCISKDELFSLLSQFN